MVIRVSSRQVMAKFVNEVFYVDDSPDDRLFASLCHTRGTFHFGLVMFSDGLSAIAEIERRSSGGQPLPGLLVVDHYMPGMDGPEVLRLIRANPALDAMVLAVCSGGTDPVDQQTAREAGAQAVLEKPLDLGRCVSLLGARQPR